MSFEDRLIDSCELKQRKLMRPAKIASERPDTGVTILNKSAYFVIRDCADVTQRYLALLCYGSLSDPIASLKGRFKKLDIIDFVTRARDGSNAHTRQLLCAIVADVNKCECVDGPHGASDDVAQPIDVAALEAMETQEDDIYGDYDYVADATQSIDTPAHQAHVAEWLSADLTEDAELADRLIHAFQAK